MSTTTLTRREQRAKAQHFIDTLEGTAFPNSKRIYVTGSQHDIRVPMREIQLSPTLIGGSKDNPQFEENEVRRGDLFKITVIRCDLTEFVVIQGDRRKRLSR